MGGRRTDNTFEMELGRSHTFHQLYYHLVWSTKNREPLITAVVEKALYRFLLGKIDGLEGKVLEIGGIEDHIHLLVQLAPKDQLAKFVKDLKGSSSHYLNHKSGMETVFKWQAGYGAFSIGYKEVSFVQSYISHQKEHHREGKIIEAWEKFDEKDRPSTLP